MGEDDHRSGFGPTYIKIGTIQRRLAWPLRKDDTQIREAFQIFVFMLCYVTNQQRKPTAPGVPRLSPI